MSSQVIRHAFFSEKQKKHLIDRNIRRPNHNEQLRRAHTNIYLTTDGREVEVTEVCKDADSYKKRFPDFVYLGQVTKWVRLKYY